MLSPAKYACFDCKTRQQTYLTVLQLSLQTVQTSAGHITIACSVPSSALTILPYALAPVGLVMPKFARSKAEMVAAGVIPIDRLSAIRAPMDVVVARVGRGQLSQVYGLRLPPAAAHMHADSAPTADQVLRAYATLRGWTAGSGLPDETRAGRQLLRDYTTGKLLYCQLPPGAAAQEGWAPAGNPATSACNIRLAAPALPQPKAFSSSGAAAPAQAAAQQAPAEGDASPAAPDEQASLPTAASSNDWSALAATASNSSPASTAGPRSAPVASSLVATTSQSAAAADTSNAQIEYVVASPPLDEADLELLESLQPGVQSKLKRPDYKFQKKQARSKGTRGEQRAEGLFDGAALVTGKKGGLVRVGGYH